MKNSLRREIAKASADIFKKSIGFGWVLCDEVA
jgi:hypothetical protein